MIPMRPATRRLSGQPVGDNTINLAHPLLSRRGILHALACCGSRPLRAAHEQECETGRLLSLFCY